MQHWQSWWILNRHSPSSNSGIVAKIAAQFMGAEDCLALDIGGTQNGFIGHLGTSGAQLFPRVRLVNPKGNAYARSVADVPDADRYDLIMCFGTLMYMSKNEASSTFSKVAKLLKPTGTFLVAEPDSTKFLNRIDTWMKKLPIFLGSTPAYAYSPSEIEKMMSACGLIVVRRQDLSAKHLLRSLDYVVYAGHH